MFTQLFESTNIPVLQEVLHFSHARHEVLAGNVANLSTPGYRVRDLSVENFQAKLREALEQRKSQAEIDHERLSPGLANSRAGDPLREVRDSLKGILFHDGSDVGIEQQVTELSKNQMMHNLTVSLMQSQFRLIETAISERIPV